MQVVKVKYKKNYPAMNLLKRFNFNYSLILLVLTTALFNCTGKDSVNAKDNTNPKENDYMNIYLTTDNYVRDIVNHPSFKGFGELLLPFDDNTGYYNTRLVNVGSLMPYHKHVRPDIVLGAINYMIEEVREGRTIFGHPNHHQSCIKKIHSVSTKKITQKKSFLK